MHMRKALFAFALLFATLSTRAMAGTLFIGSDTEDFANTLPDHLLKADVTGATFNSLTTINLDFHLNGLGDAPGNILYAGEPSNNTLKTIDYNGNLLTSMSAPGIPNSGCCNEELQLNGGVLYHAHYLDEIEALNPGTGALLAAFPQDQVVGMALVGTTIWISKWTPRTVGTWDPVTNTYTPVFSTDVAGRNPGQDTGALAYDPVNSILWIGFAGGDVVPYTLTGTKLNNGFQPLGAIPDTIDGLTFLGEGSQTPEPGTMLMVGSVLALAGIRTLRRRKS
jgi:hypothetical protein